MKPRGIGPVLLLVLAAGCGGNSGMPRFRRTTPPPLPPSGAQVPEAQVRIELRALPWWTIAGTPQGFILQLEDDGRAPTAGRRLGPLRSRDILLSPPRLDAVRCAWMIVPMGDPRPCPDLGRQQAMAIAMTPIESARADLREQAGELGVHVVGDVRCFAEQSRENRDGRLWCEGVAIAAPESNAPVPVIDPAAPIAHEPRGPESRFVLHSDGSVGMVGSTPIVGATLGLRYRPFEVGFYILDLQRDSLAPMDGGLVGLGGTALGRLALGDSRVDLIAGISALAVARNGSTNPDFDGLYVGFAGLAYQTPWRISGVAQPFVQLRAGAARGSDIATSPSPVLELHIGLSTPERR